MHDIRLALRQWVRQPGFTLVVIISLAVGIGANTAVFTVVNDVLLRPLAVKSPDELVLFRTLEGPGGAMARGGENYGFIDPATGRFNSTSFSTAIFERLQSSHDALTTIFAFAPLAPANVLVDGQPEADPSAQLVSGDYYAGLGVPAMLGRSLTPADDRPDAPAVAMISYRYWTRRFGAQPDAIGKIVELNRVPTTIVGVTPPGFDGTSQAGESPDISVPLSHHLDYQPERSGRSRASYWWLRTMGRLAPGRRAAQAVASLEPAFRNAAREGWLADRPVAATTAEKMPADPYLLAESGARGENDVRRQLARPLQILLILAAVVLLCACANVANLLLARGADRGREMALRVAMGASRGRIVRQLLIESSLLVVGGAAAGMALAWLSRGALRSLRPLGAASRVLDLPFDGRVLAFTLIAAAVSAFVFGVAPALMTSRVRLGAEIQHGQRTLRARHGVRVTHGLMVIQIAIALICLVCTGLFVRTLVALSQVDAGFDRRGLVLFRIDAGSVGYRPDRIASLQTRLQERLERVPGVQGVTFSSVALLSGVRQNRRITLPGFEMAANAPSVVDTNGLAANFFAVMRLPIVVGRGFTNGDDENAPKVAVVNQAFVRTYFGDANPLRKLIVTGSAPPVEIVGIAGDAKYTQLRLAVPPTIYFPAGQRVDSQANFAIRLGSARAGTAEEPAVMAAVRAAVRDVDPALSPLDMRTQDEQIDRLNAQPLLFARLSAAFGTLAIGLACMGLYGLMSHGVATRTREIGLRMALGAAPRRVLTMILTESVALVGLGLATGSVGAYALSRAVASMLFGLSPSDSLTFALAALSLAAAGLLASWLPARRASRIDPNVALKME